MIDSYFDPASGSYLGFPIQINGIPTDPEAAWTTFQTLSPAEQQVVIYEAFFDVIKDVAKQVPTKTNCPEVCAPALQVISTLFPSGHTLGSGELDLLHGTIQTRLGGSISILGPGGDITVGSLATEPNPNLKLRDLGILTLGGGDINTYTDGNVLVNSSRVLTTQGGDVLMWTSFGDLDAGRGSKTIASAPALQVNFDQNDYETIDPGGYVTGSGIGTLQASSSTPPGNLYLVAPNGTIDFGTAGVRASGNAVFFAPVITNASNFQVSGTATGVPTIPSLSGTIAQSANTTQTKPIGDPTASGSNNDRASVFIVEVIGYGGGDNSSTPSTDDDKKTQKP
jgi:Filamentous haemagglutinin family outer membrane protein